MIPNEYHNLVAKMLLDIDIERLDAAIREKTGHGLLSLIKDRMPSRGNLDFKSFKLQSFTSKDHVIFIGREPATETHPANVWEIKCKRAPLGSVMASASLNGETIFSMRGKSLWRIAKCAVSALHRYKEESIRKRRSLCRARKAKKGGEA